MKAAVLNAFGSPLAIETLPDPCAGAGSVVVDVVAAGVTSYAANVFNGSRNYALELPVVPGPGGIGRVRAIGPDATRLIGRRLGVLRPDGPLARRVPPDTILQGWTYRTEAALPLHRLYHHGSFAEQMLVPTENVTPDRRHRPGGGGPMDRARPAASALWRPAGGRSEGRRNPGGERRHRRLRQRRRRRGAGDGRGKGRRRRPQRAGAGGPGAPLRAARCGPPR